MNCRDIESLILAERDRALAPAEREVLSVHLAACPACQHRRRALEVATAAYRTEATSVRVPDAGAEWEAVRATIRSGGRAAPGRRLAPVIWFSAPLAAAAALAVAFFASRPAPSPETLAFEAPPYDPSVIAGADYVEAGDPNASTLVYVDKDSGWLVVWAADAPPAAKTKG